jgi:gliding motility-associated-like protein
MVNLAYVTDDNGCSDSLMVNLDCKQVPIFIPQLVSPNGDGKNDTWVIANLETYPNNKVKIFNRWGNEVFVADPYLNDWDGKSNNLITIGNGLLPASM